MAAVLNRCGETGDGHQATRIAGLLQSGMWDNLAPDDRGAFCDRGEILDTPGGEMILRWLSQLYGRDPDAELAKARKFITRRMTDA